MRKIILVYLTLALIPQTKGMASSVNEVFEGLNSKNLKVLETSKTLNLASKTAHLNKIGLTWRPPKELKTAPDQCQISEFKLALFHSRDAAETMQSYWKKCEPFWRLNNFNIVTQAQDILRTDFEPIEHPGVRAVEWTLSDQIKLKSFLFLKGPRPRPLVILRAGIFSHLRSAIAERFLMMQLFEDGPYHLLVLPNSTGEDFIRDNHKFQFGGFDEALQNEYLLDLLMNPEEPLHKLITKIHFVGISLGAHSGWFTGLLEQRRQASLIDKTLLLCPIVDLRATSNSQSEGWLKHFLFNTWFRLRLSPLRQELQWPESESVDVFLERQFISYSEPNLPWPRAWPSPPFQAPPFWSRNDLWSWVPKYDLSRTTVIWNRVDPVVPPDLNSNALRSKVNGFENHFLILPRGFHCSLAAAYQWGPLSLSLRGALDPQWVHNTKTVGNFSFSPIPKIKSIEIRKIVLESKYPLRTLAIGLFIRFQNPIFPPKEIQVSLATNAVDQEWLLETLNLQLEQSLIRELTSRMDWRQTEKNWNLLFFAPPAI